MKTLSSSLLFVVACLAVSLAATRARAQFPNFPAADLVLGPTDFTTVGSTAATPSTMSFPSGLAIDPLTGKLFVAVTDQRRVMRFPEVGSLANGANAESVFGQVNFSGSGLGNTATTLNSPYGVHVDRTGRLWVADYFNNRVLMFLGASTLGLGATADRVFGQPDFNTVSAGTSATKMGGPIGVYVDAADNLWVVELVNHRVLKFANVSSLASGSAATAVLGQPNFTTDTSGTSAVKMSSPLAVTVDGGGRLWVADEGNHRVLRYDNAATLGNGSGATGVLGQPNFITTTADTTAQAMISPTAVLNDQLGTLYVSDGNRVLVFKNAAAKANGAAADGVIGQPDFTTSSSGTTERILSGPTIGGLAFDGEGRLWLTDANNSRVLRFSPDTSVTPPSVTGKVAKTTTSGKITIKGTAGDPNGVAQVRFRVGKGAFKPAIGTTAWKLSAKLKPGKNTIEIVAVDSTGNVSSAKKVKVKRE